MAQCVQCGRQLPGLTFGRKICQWCKQHEAAQRGEDTQYQRVETAPWARPQSSSMMVTQGIFGANVAVFVAMTLAVGLTIFGDPAWNELTLRLGANYGPYTITGQWWRLLASVFIHAGLLHIAFNMWCLWDLGRLAESVYGHWTFAVVYLLCGLSGSLMSVAWHYKVPVPSVGASGAIFGIAGALIASFYLGEFSLPRAAVAGMLRSVGAFVGYNLFFGVVILRVDNSAHVGGLLMGLLLGALIAKVAPHHDAIGRRIGVLLVGAALVAGAGIWLARLSYLGHEQIGELLLQDRRPDEAIKELQESVRQRSEFAPTHAALARAYVGKHDYDHAAMEFKQIIALNPRDEGSYYRLALIYLGQKQASKAEDVFRELLKINPNSADGHAGLAGVLSDEHRNPEALEEYKRVADIDSLYQGVNYNMGVVEARLNKFNDAIASLLKQRQAADDPDNENLLAAIYEAKGMKKEAEAARARPAAVAA